MAYNKKTWKEKLADEKDFPRLVRLEGRLRKLWGAETCVIPAPREVDAVMRKVPRGRLITINQIREAVARKHGAEIGCPITTGIFARVAAGAAGEDAAEGRKRITPYWRTLKEGGVINEKYPGGPEAQKKLLEAEGHTILQKGKKFVVADYKRRLACTIGG
jgi:alkylated DNA nucleotide flippase Atl1